MQKTIIKAFFLLTVFLMLPRFSYADIVFEDGSIEPHLDSISADGSLTEQPQDWHWMEVHFKLADSWNGSNGLYGLDK